MHALSDAGQRPAHRPTGQAAAAHEKQDHCPRARACRTGRRWRHDHRASSARGRCVAQHGFTHPQRHGGGERGQKAGGGRCHREAWLCAPPNGTWPGGRPHTQHWRAHAGHRQPVLRRSAARHRGRARPRRLQPAVCQRPLECRHRSPLHRRAARTPGGRHRGADRPPARRCTRKRVRTACTGVRSLLQKLVWPPS